MRLVSILVEEFPENGGVLNHEIEQVIEALNPSEDMVSFITEHVGGRPNDRRVSICVVDVDGEDRDRRIVLEFKTERIPKCISEFITEYVGKF